jgi:DNA primase
MSTMSGRIRDEDVAYVKANAPIVEIIGDYVQLRSAGGGQLKGLCPFHDEKSPSFHVTPSRGYFHCFGCQTGGDVISFVMKMEHTAFMETVERLADRIGYQLTFVEGSASPRGQGSQRSRLVEAHRVAAEFYQGQLQGPGAHIGRDFLKERGFDQEAAAHFGVGYSPDEWDALTKHLRAQGFTVEELIAAGLAKEGQRGPIDRFRNRLMWPIRDLGGDVVGFGARKLSTDAADTSPKYLNSPETSIYKKNQVLYGLDLAKKEVARKRQAVVVEGYTDVMAAHLAGVTTAVATCGTAFGEEHIRILRRLLMDDDAFRGEVIFTFDGDEAGQKAALKAFDDDQKFVAQTFVAVEPQGMDPCELRQAQGDAAVRDLIARRVPLFEFAMRSAIKKYDLELAEGRVGALAAVAPLVGRIRDRSLRPEYIRSVAGWLGMDVETVKRAVQEQGGRAKGAGAAAAVVIAEGEEWRPDRNDPRLLLEREVLKAILQGTALQWREIEPNAFTHPSYIAVRAVMESVEECDLWGQAVLEACADDRLRSLVTELIVEPLLAEESALERYSDSVIARLREVAVSRTLAEVKSRLQRINPVDDQDAYARLFGELVALEARRRDLHELAIGEL